MRHSRTWFGKALSLTTVAALGVALMTTLGTAVVKDTGLSEQATCAVSYGSAHEMTRADALPVSNLDQEKDLLEPMACRIMPECWTNEECDARCGAGLGRCVHNKCPVRICRCS